jgi:hypothetical protein
METTRIEFGEIGVNIGTRFAGHNTREKIVDALKSGKKVVFCFTGVEKVSESFADECFAKLLEIFTSEFIRDNTSYEGADPFIKGAIRKAFVERIQIEANK